jgi:hypothetical protein
MHKHDLKTLHQLSVVYMGATDSRGSYVLITSERFKSKVKADWNYSRNSAWEIAADYLIDQDFDLVGVAETRDGYSILSTTFKPLE